jgi:cyclophilin family peptidyl-prolyl cis-trans isomerase
MKQTSFRGLTLSIVLFVVAAIGWGPLQAQDETKTLAAPAKDSADAAKQFEAKLNEWKDLLKQLRSARAKFQTAQEPEASQLSQQWDSLIAKGHVLIEELRSAGTTAYAASPNTDRQLLRFLTKLLDDDIERDNYEAAYELAKLLIENECGVREVYNQGGKAAFCVNDYDAAVEYLKMAEDNDTIDPKGREYQSLIETYRGLWEEEKKKREVEAAADDLPRVKLTTSVGEIVIELFENEAPGTVGNFISLVDKKFYDGLTFHRVLHEFMAQGGCPEGTGRGGPGYHIYCECYQENHRKHFRGSLSMAHAGKNTGGSQFFLTFVPTSHLNGQHTVFGRVIEGMDGLARIQRINPEDNSAQVDPGKILKAEVIRKRDHEYKPNKVGE